MSMEFRILTFVQFNLCAINMTPLYLLLCVFRIYEREREREGAHKDLPTNKLVTIVVRGVDESDLMRTYRRL